jgi:hypothetical protein
MRDYLAEIRRAVVDEDFMGTRAMSILHPLLYVHNTRKPPGLDVKLKVLTDYVNQTGYLKVVDRGYWLNEHMDRAFRHGLKSAERWGSPEAQVEPIYYTFAKNEVEGIVDATTQRVTRVVNYGILQGEKGRTLFARITGAAYKVMEPRLYMLGHQLIVQQHNLARLEVFRAAGHTHVGVTPERLPKGARRRPAHDHAMVRDQALVNVQTAEDDDVCEECQDLAESGPYTLEEAEALIPAHINCRCELAAVEDARFEEGLRRVEGSEFEGLEDPEEFEERRREMEEER